MNVLKVNFLYLGIDHGFLITSFCHKMGYFRKENKYLKYLCHHTKGFHNMMD